jgi:hypothetical protein
MTWRLDAEVAINTGQWTVLKKLSIVIQYTQKILRCVTLVNEIRRAVYVYRNIAARSCNHYGRGKVRSVRPYKSVFNALLNQNAKRMPCLTLPSVACLAIHTVPHYLWPVWLYILFHIICGLSGYTHCFTLSVACLAIHTVPHYLIDDAILEKRYWTQNVCICNIQYTIYNTQYITRNMQYTIHNL